MNNIIRIIVFYIVLSMVLFGCSSENDNPLIKEGPKPEDCTLSFYSNVSDHSVVTARAKTGMILGTHLPKDYQVGIYAQKTSWTLNESGNKVFATENWSNENILPTLNNEIYVAQGVEDNDRLVSLNGSKPFFHSTENPALRIYSYAPYTSTITHTPPAAPKMEIVINENMEKTIDYLYAEQRVLTPDSLNNNVHLHYKHILAKINFRVFTHDSKYTDESCPILKKVTVKTTFHQGAYLNIETGRVETIETSTPKKIFEYSLDNKPYKITSNKEGDATDTGVNFFFLAQKNAISEIILTIEGTDGILKEYRAFKYDPEQPDPKDLSSGKYYTVNIEYTVRSNINCQIESWTETDNKEVSIDSTNKVEN